MTNWTTATGETEASGSNLADISLVNTPHAVVGNRNNLEVTGNGQVTSNSSASYTMGQEAPTQGGVMATVKSHSGGSIFGRNPSGKDTVDIGGTRTNIDVAVGMGLLVRNGDGTFSDAAAPVALKDPTANAKTMAKRAEGAEAQKAEPSGVSFGEAADATMQDFLKGQNPGDLFKTVDSILQHGDADTRTIERMAHMAGVEPAEMQAQVATVWEGAYNSAMGIMAEAGVANEEAFDAFLNSNPQMQASMKEAARNYFVHHKTEGLQTMADAYLTQMDQFDTAGVREMLTEAGWDHVEKPGGGLQVLVNGTPVSWEVAVKQRIITFSQVEG
ncbi:hypothetical protein M3P21_21030 [Ruegeria sp. 2012CJ41-6]|uniref:Uncharacterized protein n=1 Tax=Ruegeria spongiae TaxID=2942209 RepID=A0ABT0QA16_9RHOB|nr:hypothetical protein [Ruegeria spongiae]MCL6286003.1 hypothetical protein [Ruegeria spongiae]